MGSVRILPALVVVLALVLAMKAVEVWTGFETVTSAWAGASKKEPAGGAKTANSHDSGTGESADRKLPSLTMEHAGEEVAAKPIDKIKRQPIPGEAEVVSAAEVEVLQSLAERRDGLKKREAELDLKENLIAAAEKRIDEKIAELRSIEAEIKSALNTLDEEEEAQIRSLVTIYEKMKPKDAAAILQNLDRPILIRVVSRMKEAKMAAILAAMEPRIAQEVTILLATNAEVPRPSGAEGG